MSTTTHSIRCARGYARFAWAQISSEFPNVPRPESPTDRTTLLALCGGGERPLFRPRPSPDKSTHLDRVACRRTERLARHDADRPGPASRSSHHPDGDLLALLGRQGDVHVLECPAGLEGGGD